MDDSRIRLFKFHAKQQLFYESEATQVLLAGDTRGGKTAGFKLSLIRWCSLIPGLQCDIFRLQLDDVIASYMRGDFGFPALLTKWEQDGLVQINQREVKFWNGSHIKLEHCNSDNSMNKHQGIPKHIRAFDEAGQIPERRMRWLTGWMIMNEEMKAAIPEEFKGMFPKVVFLSNPVGPSKNYLRKTFVRARPKFSTEKKGAWVYQYIPFNVEDNPSEDAETTRMRVMDAADADTANALLNESTAWDAETGNYFDTWDTDRHVIRPFKIPDFWLRYRTFDYGSYEPWACVWWAISPGVVIHSGTIYERYLPRGCKVGYREWYGCRAEHPVVESDKEITNLAPKGWSNEDMAYGVLERSQDRHKHVPTLTDGFPFIKLGGKCINDDFRKAGLKLTKGELDRKNRGAMTTSLLNGTKLRADMEAFAMMVFFEDMKYCRDYIPGIERHESEGRRWDYKENGEATHIVDCVTLSAVVHDIVYDAPKQSEETINRELQNPKNTNRSVKDLVPELNLG